MTTSEECEGHDHLGQDSDNDSTTRFFQQYKIMQDTPIFKAAGENDIGTVKEILATGEVNLSDRGGWGETVLQIACLFNNVGVAKALVHEDPTTLDLCCEGEEYLGQVALHIAIVNRNRKLVKFLVEAGADISTPRAMGTFFRLREQGCYYGEYPLSFAVSTCQLDVVRYLAKRGASLTAQDSNGNTALHMVAYMTNCVKAAEMYDLLISLGKEVDLDVDLERIENNDKLTPLKLAVKQANVELIQHIVRRHRTIQWSYGPLTSVVIDIDQFDTSGEPNSVLQIIMTNPADLMKELVEIDPIRQLLEDKWIRLRKWFYAWMIAYIFYMCIFTYVMNWEASLYEILSENTNFNSTQEINLLFGFYNATSYMRLPFKIIVIIGGLVIMFIEIIDIYRCGLRWYFWSSLASMFNYMLWTFIVSMLIGGILFGTQQYVCVVFFGIAALSGWLFVIYFTRGFQTTGSFSVMIRNMLVGDLLRYTVMLVIVLLAYSSAFDLIYKVNLLPPDHQFHSYPIIFFNLFKCMVGIESYDTSVIVETKYGVISVILFVSYLMFAFILLLNMLIAMMGDTYAKVSEDSVKLWKLQVGSLALLLERRLPACLAGRTGTCGRDFGFPSDKWLIRIEEYNTNYYDDDTEASYFLTDDDCVVKEEEVKKVPGTFLATPLVEFEPGAKSRSEPALGMFSGKDDDIEMSLLATET